jgi:nitrite reductase/ring-hydroxylating ferredoxin subunit
MSSAQSRWHAFPAAELDRAGRMLVRAGGREVAVFRGPAGVLAVNNACPHQGNPLIEGDVLGPTLVCAYHSWRFDLETGACLFGDEPLHAYPAELRDGAVWIALPESPHS